MSEANSGMAAKPIQFIRPGVIRQGARTSRFSEWIENFFVRHRDKLVWLQTPENFDKRVAVWNEVKAAP